MQPAGSRPAARWGLLLAVLAVLPGLAACTPAGPERAATSFWAQVSAGDGAAVCAALAPATREQVASDAEESCEVAVRTGEVGQALGEAAERARSHGDTRVTVAGRQAQAVHGGEVLFLTRSGQEWLVTAAACSPRPERPYDCEVAS